MLNKLGLIMLITVFFYTPICQADLCDQLENISDTSLRQRYKADCDLRSQFQSVKSCFESRDLNIDNVEVYRALRLISRGTYEREKSRKPVWDIYGPAPKTWFYWEEANFYRHQLQKKYEVKRLEDNQRWEMSLDDLKDLHKQAIDQEILGLSRFIPNTTAPGVIRKTGNRTAGFSITREQYEKLRNDPLTQPSTPGGNDSLITVKRNLTNGYSLSYTQSEHVEGALQDFIRDLNTEMNHYLQFRDGHGPAPGLSPFEFALRMQRRYVSIHPFHEGCGRTSRLIQELILGTLGFPYLPSGDLQEDVVTPEQDYFDMGRRSMREMNQKLDGCCPTASPGAESATESGNPDCRMLYSAAGKAVAKRIESDIFNRAVCSLPGISTLEKLQKNIEEYGELVSGLRREDQEDWDPNALRPQFHSKKEERKFIENLLESMATPIAGANSDPNVKLKTYTWVTSRQPGRQIRNNSRMFNWIVKGTAETPQNLASKGFGLYVSKNPYDSLDFGIQTRTGTPLGGNQGATVVDADRQSPWLYEVEISGDSKILHVRDKQVTQLKKRLGITDDDFIKVSPNIIIDYSFYDSNDLTSEREDWINIMLEQRNFGRKPFQMKFKQANAQAIEKLSFGERQAIIDRYKEKTKYSEEDMHKIPFFREMIYPLQEAKKGIIRNPMHASQELGSGCQRRPSSALHDLIHNECFSKISLVISENETGNPMKKWNKECFWSGQDLCMVTQGQGFQVHPDQSLHTPAKVPCMRNQDLEKRYLGSFLLEMKKILESPEACSNISAQNREKGINDLYSILIENKPFVTPTGKCGIVSAGHHIEYVSKELCSRSDPSYSEFLSQCP